MNGAELLCRTLENVGADTVFGLPGSQNVVLFEALRTSHLRTVVAVHELGASFMANGYARASGRPGILTTIPGPGFTYALTGLAEARLDSAPVVYVVGAPASKPGRRYQLQALDQRAMLSAVVKRVIAVSEASDIERSVREAYRLCREGEPGPVAVEIPPALFAEEVAPRASSEPLAASAPVDFDPIRRRLLGSRRPLFYCGQGAADAGETLRELAAAIGAPIVTTTSGRGVVPEDDPHVLGFDRRKTEVLNELVESADLVLALGCKFSHNGAQGFRLRLPAGRLVHVDASPEVLGANYEASTLLEADVPAAIEALRSSAHAASSWKEEELAAWKERAFRAVGEGTEPRIPDLRGGTPAAFFALLRKAMPRDAALVLDSGLHQMLARRHFSVLGPRTLILPTDLQSMGYAIPAAIGARLARPDRAVVALLGDGGFAMSGLELLTAVRERIPLTAIVFNDGRYGLIHRQQMGAHGRSHGTELLNPEIESLAGSIGARYVRLSDRTARKLSGLIRGGGVHVVEVVLRDRSRRRLRRAARSVATTLKNWLLPED